jgi:hypothetical protein
MEFGGALIPSCTESVLEAGRKEVGEGEHCWGRGKFTDASLLPTLNLCHPCLGHRLARASDPQAQGKPASLSTPSSKSHSVTIGPTLLGLSYQTLVTVTESQERKRRCLISLPCIRRALYSW